MRDSGRRTYNSERIRVEAAGWKGWRGSGINTHVHYGGWERSDRLLTSATCVLSVPGAGPREYPEKCFLRVTWNLTPDQKKTQE